jgi:hypothetical protein
MLRNAQGTQNVCNLHEPEKLNKRNLKPYSSIHTDDVNQNEISGTV